MQMNVMTLKSYNLYVSGIRASNCYGHNLKYYIYGYIKILYTFTNRTEIWIHMLYSVTPIRILTSTATFGRSIKIIRFRFCQLVILDTVPVSGAELDVPVCTGGFCL